jgi:AraC-like DNA-binding protein
LNKNCEANNLKINEKGVLKNSAIYFHNASTLARELYFNLLCCGFYYCDNHYKVKRNTYHSFLLLYVIKGNGYVIINDEEIQINENTLVLIDCNVPHEYGSKLGWNIFWCHFTGKLAIPWYQQILKLNNGVKHLDNASACYIHFKELIDIHRDETGSNEAYTNRLITDIISELLVNPITKNKERPFTNIAGYINNNLNKNITVDELAERACMSKFHFIRVFNKEFGFTPHEFIIHSRINAAKFFLLSSSKSIKEIVYLCGFNNESAFSNTFKKVVGMTPCQFRNKK